jgi:hypothetical protein
MSEIKAANATGAAHALRRFPCSNATAVTSSKKA